MTSHNPAAATTSGFSPPAAATLNLNQFLSPIEFLWLYGSAMWWSAVESLAYDSMAERMSSW